MKKKILIFGAGAIGRGFIAPQFFKHNFDIYFADSDTDLVSKLNVKKEIVWNSLNDPNILQKLLVLIAL